MKKSDGNGESIVGKSAFAALLEETSSAKLVTFIPELDRVLGGGIPSSRITELCL